MNWIETRCWGRWCVSGCRECYEWNMLLVTGYELILKCFSISILVVAHVFPYLFLLLLLLLTLFVRVQAIFEMSTLCVRVSTSAYLAVCESAESNIIAFLIGHSCFLIKFALNVNFSVISASDFPRLESPTSNWMLVIMYDTTSASLRCCCCYFFNRSVAVFFWTYIF